jgi:hypothetical protein
MADKRTEVAIPDSAIERDLLTDEYVQQWAIALHAVNKTFTDNDVVRQQLAKCVAEGRFPAFPGKLKAFLSELMPNKPHAQRQLDAEKADTMATVRAARKQKTAEATKPRQQKRGPS